MTVAQRVAINNTGEAPDNSAILDVKSSNSGMLLPRLTTLQKEQIVQPAPGLLLYDSTAKQFQYYDGSSWKALWPDNSGWKTGTDLQDPIPGNPYFSTATTDVTRRLVFINSPDMTNPATQGAAWRGGGLVVKQYDYGFGLYDYITLDGRGIESRASTVLGTLSRNLSLNRYGGNVGIGNTGASHARLEINGSVGASVAMFGSDKYGVTISADNPEIGFNYFYNGGTKTIKAGYGSFMGMDPGNGNIYIGNFNGATSSANFGNITGASTRMYILQNGNVGIGTTNPTYKLSVNGNIRSKEVVVESGWADYVFKEDYSLKPLSQVEAFIKANGHLPNIPSAGEIELNGLSLGDTQKRMMEKIEELTLYVIELEKKIEELKTVIKH